MQLKVFMINLLVNSVQMLLIPLFYSVLYGMASLIHASKENAPANSYGKTLIFLVVFLSISIPVFTLIESLVRNLKKQIYISVTWFVCIVLLTKDELLYQPYDFGLILFCIGLSTFVKFYAKTKVTALNNNL